MTPGAVSRQIKALEQWLGAPLFRRRHKQVVLTPLGRTYLEAVGGPLDAIAAATERARRDEAGRPLAICTYPTFALRWLVPRWGRFYDLRPDIDVQLTTSLQPADFSRDDYDAVIHVGERLKARPGLDAVKLCDVHLFPVCSPALLASTAPLREPADLSRHTLLHSVPRPQDWPRWLKFAGVDSIDPVSGVTFDSLNLVIQAAIGGVGVAIGIRELIEDDLAAGRLVQPFGPVRKSGSPFYLVYPAHKSRDRRLRAFADWLRAEADAG